MEGLKPLLILKYEALFALCAKNGITIQFVQGLRSMAEQAVLYAKGRDANGNVIDQGSVVTNAKPGQSMHNYGVAFDVCVVVNGQEDWNMDYPDLWEKMGELGESIGLEWGGHWTGWQDHPHFQLVFGHIWQDFEAGTVNMDLYAVPAAGTENQVASAPPAPVAAPQAAPAPKAAMINPAFTHTLTYGMQGSDQVRLLQDFLKQQGDMPSSVPSTGNYMDHTRAAVLAWQLRNQVDAEANLLQLNGDSFGPKSIARAKALYAQAGGTN